VLDSFRKGQRWLTLIFVSVIGLVFVFFFGSGGSGVGPAGPTGNAVVQLDDIQLTSRDFGREKQSTESRLRAQLGEAYDQVGADRYVDSQALGQLVNTLVLSDAAEEMGLHVTTEEVRRVVQASPSFIDPDGKFSPTAFNNFAQREYGTQRSFIRSFTRSLLGQKLIQLLTTQTTVSDAEIDMITRYESDEVRIAFVALDQTSLPDSETLSEEAIAAYSESNEEALRATFNERFEELSTPEQVRASHIFALAGADAPQEEEAAARALAESARTRILAGEAFAEVAAELSQDKGTAAQGGDLGLFARGYTEPEIEDAAFALESGGLSEVVRSPFGFHVISAQDRVPAFVPTFEAVRPQLAAEGATRERAQELANEMAETLAAAVAQGDSLENAASGLTDLTVERPPPLKRRPDGFVPGLGAALGLMTTAFSLEAGQSSPEIFDIEGRRVLVQVLERTSVDEATIVSERAGRRPQILSAKQNQILDAWLGDHRSRLEKSGRLTIKAEVALGS
jgi:peptidyl-prolyl cis-trans isomerase D